MLPSELLILFILLFLPGIDAHCPHMAAMAGFGKSKEEDKGPSPPGKIPEGDKGWDYDSKAAPGILPNEQYIQTSFVYRNLNEEDKSYAERVQKNMDEIVKRLGTEARLTLENENIECTTQETHYRCGDFPAKGSFHYLAVEDSKQGAAVYEIARKLNERSDGTIEMALLDALSRHSSIPLTFFASEQADKQVGFVRALSTKDLMEMQAPIQKHKPVKERIRLSPLELHLLEPSILELRSSEGVDEVEGHRLVELKTQEEMNERMAAAKHFFVLFWSNTNSISAHSFHQWALLSEQLSTADTPDTVLAHVACHHSIEMCDNLRPVDLYTVVAYKDGTNIGSTSNIGDVDYYRSWATLMMNGPVVALEDAEEAKKAKRGEIAGLQLPAVTIGVFPNEEHSSYRHFQIVAQSFYGRYAMAVQIKKDAFPSIATYRPNERKKRIDYTEEFDPASMTQFLLSSSLPSIMDISHGFTTDALFRQSRSVLILASSPSQPVPQEVSEVFAKLAAKIELSKNYIFTQIKRDDENSKAVDDFLKSISVPLPSLILFRKESVYIREVTNTENEEKIVEWLGETKQKQADFIVVAHEGHPLRNVQLGHANRLFGVQNIIILPDESLYKLPAAVPDYHSDLHTQAAAGGCPFMRSGGASVGQEEHVEHNEQSEQTGDHDEL